MAEKTAPKEIRTMRELRAEASEKKVEQIERWDDPRLVDLISALHVHAENSSYCGTFDSIAKEIGIPPRPVKDYFTIKRQGKVTFGGQDYEVEAEIEVFGEVGDEVGAIADYKARYNQDFEEALNAKLRKNALNAITNTLEVKVI